MSEPPETNSTDGESQPAPSFVERARKIPKRELIAFIGVFLLAQFLQWRALLQMCETGGQRGTDVFISGMVLSVMGGQSLSVLEDTYKIMFLFSVVAMMFYHMWFGW